MKPSNANSTSRFVTETEWLEIVRRQVATLQFGIVQIIVHESRVVQVERTEKVRIHSPTAPKNLSVDRETGDDTNHSCGPT